MIYNGISELIGNTPILRLSRFCRERGIVADICVKLESRNPAGSAKDRVALAMIEAAERDGRLKKGGVIIEPTSGNTGIGLAAIGASKGYRVILTMPDTMSVERRALLKAYCAELELTPGALGMGGAIKRAEELKASIEGSIIAGQFDNPANPEAHYRSTAVEILRDTDGMVSAFVAGIGTGGSVSGVGRYFKENAPDVKIIGVEPKESPMITEGRAGVHKIQGIGANFVPENFDASVCDEVITVSGEEAYSVSRDIAATEGLLLGVSGGASVAAALRLFSGDEWKSKTIVCLAPDSGERYLSVEGYLV